MSNISEVLKDRAISLGLCSEWTEKWGTPEKEELIKKYIKGIDFCIENDYPGAVLMKSEFDGIMQRYGIFVGEEFYVENRAFVDANYHCIGDLRSNGVAQSTIYIRGGSIVNIDASEKSCVRVVIYDDSTVNITTHDLAKVYIYKHGGGVNEYGKNIFVRLS